MAGWVSRLERKTRKLLRGAKYREPFPSKYLRDFDYGDFLGEEYELWREALANSTSYGEIGVGASTVFVHRHFGCDIRGIDTDPSWARAVNRRIGQTVATAVDVGPIGKRGRPLDSAKAEKFVDYQRGLYQGGFYPDVVLVDGRFRVSSFAEAIINTLPGTKIIFDDYPMRSAYHIVESLVPSEKQNDRQALFVRPDEPDIRLAQKLSEQFRYVMD